jgi:hypothetical protein
MISPEAELSRRDSGTAAGIHLYNAVSTGFSRIFRKLQEFNRSLDLDLEALPDNPGEHTPPVVPRLQTTPSSWVVMTDGAPHR